MQNSPNNPTPRDRGLVMHRLKPWAWLLWFIDVLLVAYTWQSTREVWAHLLWLATIGALTVLVCSFYVMSHTYDRASWVRRAAIISTVGITLAALTNALIHGWVSRSYAAKAMARQEQIEMMSLTAGIAAQERQDQLKLYGAAAELNKSAAGLVEKSAINTDADNRFYRRTGVLRSGRPAAAGAPGVIQPGNVVTTKVTAVTASPAEDTTYWLKWVYLGFAGEILVGVILSAWVKHTTQSDLNNDGIRDDEQGYAPPRRSFWDVMRGRQVAGGSPSLAPEPAAAAAQSPSLPEPEPAPEPAIRPARRASAGRANFDVSATVRNRPKLDPDAGSDPDASPDASPGKKQSVEKQSRKPVKGPGNVWRILGTTVPDMGEGYRWEGKKRGSIELIPKGGDTHGYAANLGKKFVDSLREVPEADRHAAIKAHVVNQMANRGKATE